MHGLHELLCVLLQPFKPLSVGCGQQARCDWRSSTCTHILSLFAQPLTVAVQVILQEWPVETHFATPPSSCWDIVYKTWILLDSFGHQVRVPLALLHFLGEPLLLLSQLEFEVVTPQDLLAGGPANACEPLLFTSAHLSHGPVGTSLVSILAEMGGFGGGGQQFHENET